MLRAGELGGSELGGREELRELLLQLALELLDPRLELLDAAVHPQQHLDDDLSPRVVDRLRLSALHA